MEYRFALSTFTKVNFQEFAAQNKDVVFVDRIEAQRQILSRSCIYGELDDISAELGKVLTQCLYSMTDIAQNQLKMQNLSL